MRVDNIRYLGVHFVPAEYFKCSLDHAKHSFHRATNSVFCRIGRIASGESILQRIKRLECGQMPNVMVALPSTGGHLWSTPQSLADAHYWSAVQ